MEQGDNWDFSHSQEYTDQKIQQKQAKNKRTKLVIDEDSIYEIDLDCAECRKNFIK